MQSNMLFIGHWRSENAWFAALTFGHFNMVLATLVAFVASTIGMSFNYCMGFYVSRWRDELPSFNEEKYMRIARLFEDRLFLLMIIPPWPTLEILILFVMPIFTFVCGMFRVPPRQAVATIAMSRVLCYGFYLLQ
jgi:membrane protein YqaA with SNARE-associated domain